MNRPSVIAAFVAVLFAVSLGACKTSEANYRAAYEKAVGNSDDEPLDGTVYGEMRSQWSATTVNTASGPLQVRTQLVRVADKGGGIPENLHRYNVVAAQFKQLFNAVSFRGRLADAGYPGSFVVETAEPYYYVVALSTDSPDEALAALEKIEKQPPLSMKAPCPFVLEASARKVTVSRKN